MSIVAKAEPNCGVAVAEPDVISSSQVNFRRERLYFPALADVTYRAGREEGDKETY